MDFHLVEAKSYYCDRGRHAGQFRVSLCGYVTEEEYEKLRRELPLVFKEQGQ